MYLLKRGRPLARQGWLDTFNRPNENPPKQPWRQWGEGSNAQIISGKLRLERNTGWFNWSVGGWSYEYQPLTQHWGFEWVMDFLSIPEGSFQIYLDLNWTLGQTISDDQYQTYLVWTHAVQRDDQGNPTGDTYTVTVIHRNRDSLFAATKATYSMTAAQFAAGHVWRLDVLFDRVIILQMDGTPVLLYSIDDTNYLFSSGRRGANLRSASWDTELDSWYVYDRFDYPVPWGVHFSDNFNRANGAVGNGWTMFGTNASIQNNSFSMNSGFPSDGSRAITRSHGGPSGRVMVSGQIGGNIAPSAHEAGLLLCVNNTGNQGLDARITATNAKILRFSSALTGNPPTYNEIGISRNAIGGISNGDWLSFEVWDGNGYVWRGTELLAFATNVHAVVPNTNGYAGAQVSRSTFINSASWDEIRFSKVG